MFLSVHSRTAIVGSAAADAAPGELLRECGATVRAVEAALMGLAPAIARLELPPLEGREWYRSLCEKLVPQLGEEAFLVVAVVGGTNIGKSVIFNHIADARLSATSPLASGTRHPICVVPEGFASGHDLATIFPGFEMCPWTTADDSLVDRPEDRIFWRTAAETPPNLLILDTPDIDSDVQVNWRRADAVRRVADVLIAVLTQQKYNDAAVKRYFRSAAAEGKVVLIIFNQCQLPEDEAYWPLWLDTFSRETGVVPRLIYVAPNDRRAAEEGRLPFFEKGKPVSSGTPSRLAEDLSELKFAEIKLTTLTGSLCHLMDAESGLPAFLREIEGRSAAFESAAKWLSSESVIKVRDWPSIPSALLVAEIRTWWRQRQHGLARRVHEFYDTVGRGIIYPFQAARNKLQGTVAPPMDVYRQTEWGAVLTVVEEVYERLTWLADSSDRLLKPFLDQMLAGRSRSQLLEELRSEHERVDFGQELSQAVDSEMRAFEAGSPELYRFVRQLKNASAAVRPLTSVVLFSIGWGPAAHVLSPMVAPLVDMGTHSLAPIIADFASGAAAAVAGDTAIASSANFLEARFRRLQTAFTKRRVDWLLAHLKERLFGSVPQDLQSAAAVPRTEAFIKLTQAAARLEQQLAGITAEKP
ncbi:MAG TPA: GTPase domain-containing protein [Planctomycetaceae bacterium]|nr:GTPase domain-containing protein [Planctomycetaceae bacterium]